MHSCMILSVVFFCDGRKRVCGVLYKWEGWFVGLVLFQEKGVGRWEVGLERGWRGKEGWVGGEDIRKVAAVEVFT